MKKLVLLVSLLFLFNSCQLDENNFTVEILPVHTVEIPSEFVLGEVYQITMEYYRPSNCHSPYGVYYEKDLNTRTCAVQNLVEERGNCAPVENILVQETFNFHVTNTGNYIFKFWTGTDDQGNDTFIIHDIPVN
ncbi:hypothetical protein FBBAL38_05570 [Flavobacteria bacterium BAL38]|jgi:hypothetical protein|uniref:hypothetical protein n=1 Tax=unclassified Flavobacterium TaxID=196869 RepID=UPI0000F396FB|nr:MULTISPECIES: hypothetical protein [unclassified Flavobacterium]EAZ96867.1 hypothetical protein FBBAL38_05570 [Flavobacteria bacterium BAL38]MDP5001869.1 hypothetical protein [Flavobacterium sp.]MDP5026597.1 hypothetical protein [Flavobacterium sp.]MDP5098061.1 hypothetical protein [Flavobacterium sp.]MQP51491.1 hypothetical protein [Flavobacterium sp. LMO9]